MESIRDKVAIIGTGSTRFGVHYDKSYSDLMIDAVYEAYEDAGITRDDVDAAWLGTMDPTINGLEGESGVSAADPLALYPKPISRVSAYCATGMDALRNAVMAVAAGQYETVLVVGVEKMRSVPPKGSLVSRHLRQTHPVLSKGRTAPGIFALVATRYFEEFGMTREEMAQVGVKNHYNGSLNPKAHFQKPITVDQVLRAPLICEPLGLLDCCPTTDGAAAVIITRTDLAEKSGRPYVKIGGIGLATSFGYYNIHFQKANDHLGFQATRDAAKMAYRDAGITDPLREIDVAECHDCFTITEVVNYEDLGFCAKGKGRELLLSGATRLDGEIPVNTSGGLQSCGHPVGATGLRMVSDIRDQLLGRSGPRQVSGAKVGLAHTVGGPGSLSCVAVLRA